MRIAIAFNPPAGQTGACPLVDLIAFEQTLPTVEENLALDEVLLLEAENGRGSPTIRFWEPDGQAVVLGATRRINAEVHVDACRADKIPILRRASGGGTVVVGPGTLNLTVILPQSAAPSLATVASAHAYVLERVAHAIQALGRPVAVMGLGDLTLENRKCGGSAQRRQKSWLMVHCSILNNFALELVTRYLTIPDKQPDYRRARSHRDFLSNLYLPRKILRDAISGYWSAGSCSDAAPDWPRPLLSSLLAEKYANRAWIERF